VENPMENLWKTDETPWTTLLKMIYMFLFMTKDMTVLLPWVALRTYDVHVHS
jgi:hypothetical protein